VTHLFARVLLVALATTSTCADAAAEALLCDTLKPGDTAAAAAERFTGRADSRHQRWFRIVDRANSRVIPKTGYDRVLAGWQVCIPEARLAPRVSSVRNPDTVARNDAVPIDASPAIGAAEPADDSNASAENVRELALFFLGTAVFGAAMAFGWHGAERILTNRSSKKREIRDFGDSFVKNFERPLVIEGVVSHPIRARTRWVPFHQQLDILLAPAPGRRYPNLEDHRRNVEYDVARIAHRLRHHPFVRRPLRTEGHWIVVPFRLKPRRYTGDRT
jgi:hypothetical protein